MKHLSEEELIELYYGERLAHGADLHLRSCRACSEAYAGLRRELDSILPIEAPPRSTQYGEQVWQRIRPALPAHTKKQPSWPSALPWKGSAYAAACLLIAVIAFFFGRSWNKKAPETPQVAVHANPQSMQRLVFVVLNDHLDRTERLLIELRHAGPDNIAENSQLQGEARDLLAANRLYRATAAQAGDLELAGTLDQVERILIEVANQPDGLEPADLVRIREEMDAESILFKIRVLLSRPPEHIGGPTHAKGTSI